jgi:hypothetical protein
VHDYWLGGKDNFAADRAAGDAVMEAYPGIVMSVRANRAFLARVVRFLTAEAGIRQFLDIGTGIPASSNTHEVAQSVAPESRVVYVDYDHSKSGCAHVRASGLQHRGEAGEFRAGGDKEPADLQLLLHIYRGAAVRKVLRSMAVPVRMIPRCAGPH